MKKDQFLREIESQKIRQEPLTGMYVDKDQRMNKKEQIQKANYKFGYQKVEIPQQSYQQSLINKSHEMNPKQIGPAKKENVKDSDVKNAISKARKSNFQIGTGQKV